MSIILLFLATLFLNLSCHGSEGASKLHRQHTFQSTNNEEYDCVDIYKQPAFDHILLKNHKIQMNPSHLPKIDNLGENKYSSFELQSKGCPEEMVPILRTKVDVTDSNVISRMRLENIHPLSVTQPGENFAGFKMIGDSTIYGARAAITVHNPPVQKDQQSMSLISIEKGTPDDLNFIQAGWAVYPLIYGDNRTRATGFWTTGGFRTTGCYNLFCPGFVQVNSRYYLGQIISPISVPGGQFYENTPSIYLDQETGNWWLMFDDKQIGYWPKELFTQLKGGADSIRYGGWTYNSPENKMSPPMGIGLLPDRELTKISSTFYNMQVAYEYNNFIDINGRNIERIVDNTSCYNAIYLGRLDGSSIIRGDTFNYGGPGGKCSGI